MQPLYVTVNCSMGMLELQDLHQILIINIFFKILLFVTFICGVIFISSHPRFWGCLHILANFSFWGRLPFGIVYILVIVCHFGIDLILVGVFSYKELLHFEFDFIFVDFFLFGVALIFCVIFFFGVVNYFQVVFIRARFFLSFL